MGPVCGFLLWNRAQLETGWGGQCWSHQVTGSEKRTRDKWGCGWLCTSVRCNFFLFLLHLLWFNQSWLSWDHLLKPNEFADFECEMRACMGCCQLQPYAVHEERILMWLLMSTEDIWHLKMCPQDLTSTKTIWNTVSFGVFVCVRHTDDQCTSNTWS